MITWMQRHKKYLVVTIWVATIAFIGAGFVGWGAYDLNSDRATAVAKVGDRKVSVQEFQLAYANYYNFYNNMLGGTLTKEKADQMGLEKLVMQAIINEALILNYADEIGLRVLDEEVKEAIVNDKNFQENGVFNKEKYYRVVKQTGISPKDYENNLKKALLLEKIQKALNLKPTSLEEQVFASAMFMKDRLAVDIIEVSSNEIKIDENELKKYWEAHKANYLTTKSYTLETIKIDLSDKPVDEKELKSYYDEKKYNYKDKDGKIKSFEKAYDDLLIDFKLKKAKREALETYLLFKKSKMNPTGSITIKEDDKNFPVEKLQKARVGEVLKPIKQRDGYMVVRIASVNEPTPKPFKEAKEEIYNELKNQKITKVLKQRAEARLNLFNGKDIGFVSRDSKKRVLSLSEPQSVEFINYVFDNNKLKGYKIIGNKAVLYKILEQELLVDDKLKLYKDLVDKSINQTKQAILNQNLINELKKRYEIEQYYKGN